MCKVKCRDCSLWASDKVCQYCQHYAYFRDAYRCDIDDARVSPNYYCKYFKHYIFFHYSTSLIYYNISFSFFQHFF